MYMLTIVDNWSTFLPLIILEGFVCGIYEHIGTRHVLEHLNDKSFNNLVIYISIILRSLTFAFVSAFFLFYSSDAS